jgi:uncharacterized protein DUF935
MAASYQLLITDYLFPMALLDPIRRWWNEARDDAVRNADLRFGLGIDNRKSIIENQSVPNLPPGALGPPGISNLNSQIQNPLAMPQPLREPPPQVTGDREQATGSGPQAVTIQRGDGRTSIYGVPATAITGGFLVDLGEYNSELMGRNALTTYEKMRRGDGQVDATLEACIQPILSAQWDIVPRNSELGVRGSGNGNGKNGVRGSEFGVRPESLTPKSEPRGPNSAAKAKEIAAAVKENLFGGLETRTEIGSWTTQSWAEALRNTMLMLAFGCSAYEEVWTVDGEQLRLRMLADLPPMTFYQWDVEPDGRTLRALIQYGYRKDRYERLSVPGDKLTLFTYRQEGANFWGRPILRAAYPHWYVKNALYRIDAIAAERNGMGIPVITLPPGASTEDRETAIRFVTQLAAHERTGITLPNGATFELLGVKGNVREILPSIAHHNEQITMAALAAFLNMGRTQSGSRSLGQVQNKFFLLALQNIADYVAQRITDNTIRRWVYYNYGLDAPVPQLKVANVQSRSFEDVMDYLQKLALAGVVVSDRGLRDKVRMELGMPSETKLDVVAVKGETVSEGTGEGGEGAEQISGESAGPVDSSTEEGSSE